MDTNKTITVEVVYAKPEVQRVMVVEIKQGSSMEMAIQASGVLAIFPEIDLTKHKIGVFSKSRLLSDTVDAGDRIEIYRPLTIDPMEARRIKAKQTNLRRNASQSKSHS